MSKANPSISAHNIRLYNITQLLFSLVFVIPIWIAYYQTRISITQISFLVAYQYAIQLIVEMPSGALADLIGRKYCVAIGYLLWAVSYLIIFTTQSFSALLIAASCAGLAESLISGSLEALVYDSLKQDQQEHLFAKVSAKNGLLFQFGLAFSTLLGGFLYNWHFSVPYIFCVVLHFLAFLFARKFIEPKIDSETFDLSNYIKQIKIGAKHAFRDHITTLMSVFYIIVAAITWTNNLYFFDFMLLELNFSATQRSVIGAIIRLVNVFLLNSLLRNEKIFNRQRSIFFFPIIMIVGFLPGIFFSGFWALPFVAMAVMAGTARWIILTKYTNEMFVSKYRATAISTLSMIIGILYVMITSISGPIIENHGGVKTMYSILGLISVVSVLPLAMLNAKMKP